MREYCWARAQHYMEHDTKLRKFVPLIQRALVYPVVLDARRTVLSLPPIINGAHSAVRLAAYPCMLQARWLLSGAALHESSSLYFKLCFFLLSFGCQCCTCECVCLAGCR